MNLANHEQLLAAATREDFLTFVGKSVATLSPAAQYQSNWHIEAMAYQLNRIKNGKLKRLIITIPPRHLKSTIASVAFPAFLLGHDPSKKIIVVSYSNELSSKLSADFRAILAADWYQRAFPSLSIEKDSATEVTTTQKGFRYTTSTGGTLTGRGGDLIIIDDPLKPIDAHSSVARSSLQNWYSNTLLSRLDNKEQGAMIVIMQRLHMQDLVGHILEHESGWEVLSFPAIAESDEDVQISERRWHARKVGDVLHPERESLKSLERLKEGLGTLAFSAQYQQAPVPEGGAIIRSEWLRRYDTVSHDGYVVQSWDTAQQVGQDNDYSVCTTWRVIGSFYYLIDVFRKRLDYPSLKGEVIRLRNLHKPLQIIVENHGFGSALVQEFYHQGTPLIAWRPQHDKQTRLAIHAARFEAGQVFLPNKAPWLVDFEAELMAFPQSRHDDQVDSASQFFDWEQSRFQNVELVGTYTFHDDDE